MQLNIADILLPREAKFFDYMGQQTEIFCTGCREFNGLVSGMKKLDEREIANRVAKIKGLELKGDNIEKFIISELDKTLITPIDRDDIHSIVMNIDRSLDFVNRAAQKIKIYKIRKVPAGIVRFSEIIVEISIELEKLVKKFRDKENSQLTAKNIHILENEADNLFHNAVAELFSKNDPVSIIKFKDIYNDVEDVVNSVDHIAKIIRGILVSQ